MMTINIFIPGFYQEDVIAQAEMFSGIGPLFMGLKGGVKNKGQMPAKSSMVIMILTLPWT